HQRSRNLPTEYREGEVPRADANKHASAMHRKEIALAGGTVEFFRSAKQRPAPSRVVAAEINGLAQLGDSVRNGLPCLTHQQTEELNAAVLEQIGRAVEAISSFSRRQCVPGGLRTRG